MTTLKRNLHNRPPIKKNDYQEMNQFTFEKVLSNTQKQNLAQDHRSLIDEIRSKNTLLTSVENQKKYTSTKTLPTNCEKYVNILYKKYGLKVQTKLQKTKCKEISATFLSKEQQFHRSFFLAKQFLHMTQQDFEYSIGQLLLRLKQISNNLSAKNRSLKENDKSIEDQLMILELFSNKITNKITKPQVSPFFLITKEIKSQTPDNKNYKWKANDNVKLQNNTNTILYKKGLDINLQSDKSPHLLSTFEVKQKDQENLYMSFKPNYETSQNCFSTLKYSESQLGLKFSKDQQKESQKINRLGENDSLHFSPVQPYPLHSLQAGKLKENMITDKLDIYFNEADQFLNSVTQELVSSLKMNTQNQFKNTGNLMSIYSQSVDQFSKIIQSTHLTISEQKLLIQGEWNEVSLFLNKDIQEMFDLLELERTQNQMKDKKFLENLDTIQNQLIEEIFAQKQSRKADQQLLTQVLANLAQSIQRDL